MKQEFSQFLTDVLTAAGLVANGRQDKGLASRLTEAVINLRNRDYRELEAENARLRQQLNSANSQIQILNRVIAGDTE